VVIDVLFLNTVLIFMLLISLYTDIVERKIYNWTTIPAAVLGVILNFLADGAPGLKTSLMGLLTGLAVFLLPFLLGGMGAGDVKLMGAIGALKGPFFVFQVALYSAVAGGIIALAVLVYQRELGAALKRIRTAFILLFSGSFCCRGLQNQLEVTDAGRSSFPYALAIASGILTAFAVGGGPWLP